VITAEGLTKIFFDPKRGGEFRAVDGISFNVMRGEALGIVGESGCGKSVANLSILKLIPSPPGTIESGEAVFEGRDLLTMSGGEIRKVIHVPDRLINLVVG